MKNIYVLGAGGHSKVVIDILIQQKKNGEEIKISGILDDSYEESSKTKINNVPIIGTLKERKRLSEGKGNYFIIGIGDNSIREKIASKEKLNYFTVVHPKAVIGENVIIGEGSVVMANAVINSYSEIGSHCIINTMSIVEHDCKINDYVHISPAASLAGNVSIGKRSWIGINSTIIQGIKVGEDTIIGAGSVVVKDIESKVKAFGNPCKER